MRISIMRMLLIAGGLAGLHPAMAQNTGKAEDVLRQVLTAVTANDQAALNKLSIDQSEFKKYVWPGLAAHMSGSNNSADKYYTTYQKTSQVGIADVNAALTGKKWGIVKADLESAQRTGKGFQVFGPPLVTLRDENGQERTIKLVGGLLERDGGYKVTTYYVSPSQRANK